MAVKAIETEYKGHLMRSRLEARWAVFFDALGIAWHYEDQGYELPSGRYLPDFRLEGAAKQCTADLHAEVKGKLDFVEFLKTVRAAAELPRSGSPSAQLLLLMDIPEPQTADDVWTGIGQGVLHPRIDLISDCIAFQHVYLRNFGTKDEQRWSTCPVGDPQVFPQTDIRQWTEDNTAPLRALLSQPLLSVYDRMSPWVNDAYRAARSARFEHGESGATL